MKIFHILLLAAAVVEARRKRRPNGNRGIYSKFLSSPEKRIWLNSWWPRIVFLGQFSWHFSTLRNNVYTSEGLQAKYVDRKITSETILLSTGKLAEIVPKKTIRGHQELKFQVVVVTVARTALIRQADRTVITVRTDRLMTIDPIGAMQARNVSLKWLEVCHQTSNFLW